MVPCIRGPEDGLEMLVRLAGKEMALHCVFSLAVWQVYQRYGKEKHTVRTGVS